MKRKIYLIYDVTCPFCSYVALMLKHLFEVQGLVLIGNDSKKALKLSRSLTKKKIQKDVHLVLIEGKQTTILSGADAVARVVSTQDNLSFLWKIHRVFPWPARLIYFISKKIRKHLIK